MNDEEMKWAHILILFDGGHVNGYAHHFAIDRGYGDWNGRNRWFYFLKNHSCASHLVQFFLDLDTIKEIRISYWSKTEVDHLGHFLYKERVIYRRETTK